MTEDQLEQEALGWLADVGYQHRYGPELAPDGSTPERSDYRQVLLVERLRQAVAALNPNVPTAAREDAVKQVVDLGTPVLLAANRQFHRLLVTGVPVQYQRDGETRGDFVRLVDWAAPARNEWLAVNQFSITGPHHTRRPDIILFVNGLPLVLIELKNPADANADVWKAFQQIQTYKEQIADAFQYNEVLVISDGTDALLGSLSADSERFMPGARSTASRSTRWGRSTNCRRWCAACWHRPSCWTTCASSCCLKTTAAWSRRSPVTTSSMPCARPLPRWWQLPAPTACPVCAARVAWCGTPRAAARASR
jgi:type I site-specific restriction-modification system R (restriction) subunit